MLSINSEFNGITFKVEFKDKINLFNGNSGEGKTFLFKMLDGYFEIEEVAYSHFDSRFANCTESQLISLCTSKSVIIFDNADLYLTQPLLDFAVKTADTVIISMKNPYELSMSGTGFYSLNYESHSLSTRRRNIY